MNDLMTLFVVGMHIPDGFLNVTVALVWWAITAIVVFSASRQSRHSLNERQIPLTGVMAAFIFAAQMLNFPIPGGTSGHLLGGALAALVLGPWTAILAMTCVIALQALLFQDGGLLALGANIFNMGIATALITYVLAKPMLRITDGKPWGLALTAFVTGWVSVMLGATLTSLQLILSGTASPGVVLPAMLIVHAVIGIGEGLITVAAVSFIYATRPDLLEMGADRAIPPGARRPASRPVTAGVITAVGLAIAAGAALLSPLASPSPDGLERVAEDTGFLARAQESLYQIMPDYTIPGVQSETLSTILAGFVGLLIVFALAYGITMVMRQSATSD